MSLEPGYETLPERSDIEFIDESADELDDELGHLNKDEDVTIESNQSSSLIHMSVMDSGPGVRRSSVVVIEHVDMTPVPSADSSSHVDEDQDINTHIFV